jgi:hypothetical protein
MQLKMPHTVVHTDPEGKNSHSRDPGVATPPGIIHPAIPYFLKKRVKKESYRDF